MRNRREIRGVGLQNYPLKWNMPDDFGEPGVLECHYAADSDAPVSQTLDLLKRLQASAVGVQIPSQPFVPVENLQKVAHRVAQVDVDRQVSADREVKLPFKGLFLFLGKCLPLVVVETYLADSHNFASGACLPLVEETNHFVDLCPPVFAHRTRVQADHRTQRLGIFVHDVEHFLTLRSVDVGLEHEADTFGLGLVDVRPFLSAIRFVADVTMCVYEYHAVKDRKIRGMCLGGNEKNRNIQKKRKHFPSKPPRNQQMSSICPCDLFVKVAPVGRKKQSAMEMSFEERAGLCALNRIFGFEPKVGLRLLEESGSAEEVFRKPEEAVRTLGLSSRLRFAPLITGSAFESAAMELESLERDGCRFVGIGEKGYPALLVECEDPPLGLYYKGVSSPEDVFAGLPQVAVVGTRGLTYYGKDWCQRIVKAMSCAKVKPLVVSGLALGVDVTAHRVALDSGLPTVAVMATGIDDIYPSRNRDVGEAIASTPGCALVTDYPPGTGAVRINFLRRNRIIAGICRATVLVESKIRGGGMMTARLAASYGRDVYALPGRIDDPVSQGCNLLIRENVAEQIGDLGELISRLGLGRANVGAKEDFRTSVEEYYKGRLEGTEYDDVLRLATTVKSHRGISVDELCEKLKWTYSHVSHLATTLECDGFITVDLLQHCYPGRQTTSMASP